MKLSDVLQPVSMLVMYQKQSNRSYGGVSPEDVYFEYAPIVNGITGACIPLSAKVSAHMGKMLSTAAVSEIGGYIPENVIYCGFNGIKPSMMWYTPPGKRRLIYDESNGIKEATFNMPWLVWYYTKEQVHIWSAKEKPTPATLLFVAPFSNVTGGQVCMGGGSFVIDKGFVTFDALIAGVELAFFNTKFTHQSEKSIIKGNLMTLHKRLNGTDKKFPVDLLIPALKTINRVINEKTGSKYQDPFGPEETEEDEDT